LNSNGDLLDLQLSANHASGLAPQQRLIPKDSNFQVLAETRDLCLTKD
jgi:hypothetical protein